MTKTNYGTVESEYGTLNLTQDAALDNCDGAPDKVAYYADAVDKDDNHYRVVWYRSQAYRDALDEDPDCGYCEDESNACDWDNPDQIDPA